MRPQAGVAGGKQGQRSRSAGERPKKAVLRFSGPIHCQQTIIKSAFRRSTADPMGGPGIGPVIARRTSCAVASVNDWLHVYMRALARLFERLAYIFRGSIAFSGHVLIRENCPHCHMRALCEASVLRQRSRCLKCGRSTREPNERLRISRRDDDRELVAA